MGLADDIREFTERMSNKKNEDEFDSDMKYIHKRIKESAANGKFFVKMDENYFNGPNKQRIIDQLISEGFFVCGPSLLSNTVRGITNNDWTIDWYKDED